MADRLNKYHRQILLPELGLAGQEKLSAAKVLVTGAGGLGCPVLQYLAAAGVGTIGIVDFDTVDITNLHRQVLYTVDDVGKQKVSSAAAKLRALNPLVSILEYPVQLTNQNALELVSLYDLVVDGTDNFATRYMINDACVLLNKPLVYGAVLRFEGQVSVFNVVDIASGTKTNYRDLFPVPPDAASSLSCSEAGVLGVLPGIIGTLQATEAIKWITGIGTLFTNTLLTYNALHNSFYDIQFGVNERAILNMPLNEVEYKAYNYELFCNANASNEITGKQLEAMITRGAVTIVDVREAGELPLVSRFTARQMPLSTLADQLAAAQFSTPVVVFCQTGKRSLKALRIMQGAFPTVSFYSLKGGVDGFGEI